MPDKRISEDPNLAIPDDNDVIPIVDISADPVVANNTLKWSQLRRPTAPDFTYNAGGQLTSIAYGSGESKTFTYDAEGKLQTIDFVANGLTLRKTFTYQGDGALDYITQAYI